MNEEVKEVKRLKRVFATVYFVQGMSHLPDLSIFYYMMNVLQLGPVAGQFFQGLNKLAWFMKPVWGFISDRFRLFGYRRKSYFLIMAILAFISWMGIALCSYLDIKWAVPYFILINIAQFAYAFVDVVVDALMVERGQVLKKVGSFVNYQWTFIGVALVIISIFGGWFQTKVEKGEFQYWVIFACTAIFPFLTAIVGSLNFEEEHVPGSFSWKNSWSSMKTGSLGLIKGIPRVPRRIADFVKREKLIFLLVLFIFFWNFSPSVGYVSRTFLVKERGFTPMVFGVLKLFASVTWILSLLFYRWMTKRFRSITWDQYLYAMIALGAVSLVLGYYFYLPPDHPLSWTIPFDWSRVLNTLSPIKDTPVLNWVYQIAEGASTWNRYHWWALLVDNTLSFATMPAFIIPLTLAGEATSKENAGMMYALLMSVSNFTNAIEDVAGGVLYQFFSFSWMKGFMTFFENSFLNIAVSHDETVLILQIFVYISAFFTVIAIPFIYMVKKGFEERGIQVHLN